MTELQNKRCLACEGGVKFLFSENDFICVDKVGSLVEQGND